MKETDVLCGHLNSLYAFYKLILIKTNRSTQGAKWTMQKSKIILVHRGGISIQEDNQWKLKQKKCTHN